VGLEGRYVKPDILQEPWIQIFEEGA